MGQLNSTKLHRIPFSMLWDSASISKRFSKEKQTSQMVIERLLSRSFNYLFTNDKIIWTYSDHAYYQLFLMQRRLIPETLPIRKLTTNANRGTNRSLPGSVRVFDLGGRTFFVNGYLGFSFERVRSFMRRGLQMRSKIKRFKTTENIWAKTRLRVFNKTVSNLKQPKAQITSRALNKQNSFFF